MSNNKRNKLETKSGSVKYRGLVLEGGGAKGAWQFGALKALKELGITFDYVSGTSVGALNGALWATNRLDIGNDLWTSLSMSKIFSLRWILFPVFIIGFVFRLYYAYFMDYINSEIPKLLSFLFLLITVLPFISFFAGLYLIVLELNIWLLVIYLAISIISIYLICKDEHKNRRTFVIIFGSMLAIPVISYLISFIGVYKYVFVPMLIGYLIYKSKNDSEKLRDNILLLAIWCAVILWSDSSFGSLIINNKLFAIGIIPYCMLAVGYIFFITNIALFDPSPLSSIISEMIKSRFSTPLYATAAIGVPAYYDPQNFSSIYISNSPTYDQGDGQYYPVFSSRMMPLYIRVDQLNQDETRKALLASSALPLGITPWRMNNSGSKLVDGGVADNVPWHPFATKSPCDEIFIIGCNPSAGWDDCKMKLQWQQTDRLQRIIDSKLRVSTIANQRPVVENLPDDNINLRDPDTWPSKIIIICPERPLGNFLTATLNFSKSTSLKHINDGYHKAIEIMTNPLNSTGRSVE